MAGGNSAPCPGRRGAVLADNGRPRKAGPSSKRRTLICSTSAAWKNGTVPSSSEPIWRGKYFACLDLFQGRWVSGRFHAHGEEGTEKKQGRAPELGVGEALAKKNCGK